jgi:hypothetical protein
MLCVQRGSPAVVCICMYVSIDIFMTSWTFRTRWPRIFSPMVLFHVVFYFLTMAGSDINRSKRSAGRVAGRTDSELNRRTPQPCSWAFKRWRSGKDAAKRQTGETWNTLEPEWVACWQGDLRSYANSAPMPFCFCSDAPRLHHVARWLLCSRTLFYLCVSCI